MLQDPSAYWINERKPNAWPGVVNCVSIIGMAGAGKSTIGRELAKLLNWEFLDTDHVIEAAFGHRLQTIVNGMDTSDFLDLEGTVISGIGVKRCVLSTGGSVVYRQPAVDHLKKLGPVVYLNVSLQEVLARIARNPDRGLAIKPGQTVEDLYNERRTLYEASADITALGGPSDASIYAADIFNGLKLHYSLLA